MRYTRDSRHLYVCGLLFMVVISTYSLAGPQPEPPTILDIYGMAKTADFIFKGKVIDIQYRNSESVEVTDPYGKPVYDEEGNVVLVEGSALPYTFATFAIDRIYKGKAPLQNPDYLTLRIVGGLDEINPDEIVEVPHFPHFDITDRDILFVYGNTLNDCPLVGAEDGRFRVIQPPNANQPVIFSDKGHQIIRVPDPLQGPDLVDLGPFELLPEVLTYHYPGCDECSIEVSVVMPEGEVPPPVGNPNDPQPQQFTEFDFDQFLDAVVAFTHTQDELDKLPPVTSADITVPFFAPSAEPAEPNPLPPDQPFELPRPWLDQLPPEQRGEILENERLEQYWFDLNAGDPVLPSTPCQQQILTLGPLPGDISGPSGKPDCHVDIFDLAALAASWLECNEPANPECTL